MNNFNLLVNDGSAENFKALKEKKLLNKMATKATRQALKGTAMKSFAIAAGATVALVAATCVLGAASVAATSGWGFVAFMGSIFSAMGAAVTPFISAGIYQGEHFNPTYKALHADLKAEQKQQRAAYDAAPPASTAKAPARTSRFLKAPHISAS